jgi:hypothetical protein
MKILVATLLALTILGAEARACSSFADLLFGKSPTWDQHVDDEAFGDEFGRK